MPPYTFTKLTTAQRREIAEAQVEQFERELFGHQLNRARLVAAGQSVTETDKTIATIERAITTTVAEAAKLR